MVVIFQVSVMPNLAIQLAFPNLILIGLLILLFTNNLREGLWWAVFGGLFFDIFSPLHFGIYTLVFLFIYVLIYFSSTYLISDFSFIIIVLGFIVGSLLIDLIPFIIIGRDWLILLFDAIYNTILGIIIYYFCVDKLEPKEQGYKL